MLAFRRRWQSIDRKLPLLASALVVLTAVVLSITAYALLRRALVDAAARRLQASAAIVAQMIMRPGAAGAAAMAVTDSTIREFAAGRASRDQGLAALAAGTSPGDTLKLYGAFLDTAGRPVLEYRRGTYPAPRWPAEAVARGQVGDSLEIGPFEDLGVVAMPTVHALRESRSAQSRVIGYVVNTRAVTGRTAARFGDIIGKDAEVLVGQPGTPVWTDMLRVVAAPPATAASGRIVSFRGGLGAFAAVPGTPWQVWVAQPREAMLSPARRLLWTIIPAGLLIALAGAAATWRLTRRITRPIAQLTEAAENVAADNGDRPMQPTVLMPITTDEVVRLRYAFERMARRVAERQTLEMQLRHAQKMEAVGRLAGGVAHDFNNLLTAIRSYADLLLSDTPDWDPKRADLLEIRKASERAATLTAQLLAFSRKQMLQPRVLDTAAVIADIERMLRRLLHEDTTLAVEIQPGLWPVKVDRGQLDQVIVNLTVNARDAMPHGGIVRLRAMNDTLEHPVATGHGEVPAGEYVSISVTDTGVGMDAKTQSQVFEPFFTTKPLGTGTGLGLATVHGIVAQSGGYITVESELQKGTTFTVFLPRVMEQPRVSGSRPVLPSPRARGAETILLVEDEKAVRALSRRVLERSGYRILEAAAPSEALELARRYAADIDLVLSDVVMPEMSGPVLVSHLIDICPGARVLFISGYTDDEIIGRGLAEPGLMLLPKPFSAQELVERVRQALDQREESVSTASH